MAEDDGQEAAADDPPWLVAYRAGATLREAADLAGVSRQALVGRLRARSVDVRSLGATVALRHERHEQRVALARDAVRASFLRTLDVGATAREVGLTVGETTRCLRVHVPECAVLLSPPATGVRRYSDQDLVRSLREAATAVAVTPLTRVAYAGFADAAPLLADGRPRPRPQTMTLRFGSWGAALAAAGLPARSRRTAGGGTDERAAIRAVVRCWAELGAAPTVAAYATWQRSRPGMPSAATVRRLSGSWRAALVEAWQVRHATALG